MAEINLSPTLNVSPGLSALNIEPVTQTPDIRVPSFKEMYQGNAEMNAAVAEANASKIAAEQKARKLKADAKFNTLPIQDQQAVLGYHQEYGAIPRDAMGQIDLAKVHADREEMARMRKAQAIQAGTMSGLKTNETYKVNPATGQMEQVVQWLDAGSGTVAREIFTGGLAPASFAGSGATKGGFTALQAAEERKSIDAAKEVHRDVLRAQNIIRQLNTVGPVVGSGPGRLFARLKAAFGAEGQFNAQRTITRLISAQTLENANKLKGPLTEKELGFLKNSIPNLDDTEAVWETWLQDLNTFYERAITEREATLDGTPLSQEQLDAAIPPGRSVSAASPATPPVASGIPTALPSLTITDTGTNAPKFNLTSVRAIQDAPPMTITDR